MAAWVIQYGMDGIDVDYEVLPEFFLAWDVTMTHNAGDRTLLRLTVEAAMPRRG